LTLHFLGLDVRNALQNIQRASRRLAVHDSDSRKLVGRGLASRFWMEINRRSYRHTTTYYYLPRVGAQSRGNHTPAKVLDRVVEFVPASNTIYRPARDDERYVMQHFTAHASYCPRCEDRTASACRVTRCASEATPMPEILRNRSTPNPVSFTRSADRNATDARVQIEIPARCDAIRELLKVVDQGLKVKGPASRPVVIHSRSDIPCA
jgi:hypothetical protein